MYVVKSFFFNYIQILQFICVDRTTASHSIDVSRYFKSNTQEDERSISQSANTDDTHDQSMMCHLSQRINTHAKKYCTFIYSPC